MTWFGVAHDDGLHRVYRTETGIDRAYVVDAAYAKPRQAIDHAARLNGETAASGSPVGDGSLLAAAGAPAPTEASVPSSVVSSPSSPVPTAGTCPGCGAPLPPGRHGQRRLTCSPACRERARYRRAAATDRPDVDGAAQNLTPSRPSDAPEVPTSRADLSGIGADTQHRLGL